VSRPIDFSSKCPACHAGAVTNPRFAVSGDATIHKSQGSEYPVVVVPVVTQRYPMLQRNLLYTGVTRAKRLVVGRLAQGCGDRRPWCIGAQAVVEAS